ncbi:hypothetical protein NGA_0192800, partial [Nannochloropsis gaditana CCMP526]|uniref:uncharacterized protein n=1 Tax=Nannochloropsis gaditana (strain CCMP526) TaxID=1093141 RepID=UPI00029F53A4
MKAVATQPVHRPLLFCRRFLVFTVVLSLTVLTCISPSYNAFDLVPALRTATSRDKGIKIRALPPPSPAPPFLSQPSLLLRFATPSSPPSPPSPHEAKRRRRAMARQRRRRRHAEERAAFQNQTLHAPGLVPSQVATFPCPPNSSHGCEASRLRPSPSIPTGAYSVRASPSRRISLYTLAIGSSLPVSHLPPLTTRSLPRHFSRHSPQVYLSPRHKKRPPFPDLSTTPTSSSSSPSSSEEDAQDLIVLEVPA